MIMKLVVFCAVLASATLAAAAPEPRAPTGKWHVNVAHSQCIALRDYGAEPGSPKLLLKAPAPGDVMQVAVLRDAARCHRLGRLAHAPINGVPFRAGHHSSSCLR